MMISKLKDFFKPRALSFFIFVIIIILQYEISLYMNSGYYFNKSMTYGFGKSIIHLNDGQRIQYHINGLNLTFNILLCFIIATSLSYLLQNKSNTKKQLSIHLKTIIIIYAVTFIASVIISTLYWGYPFHKPPVLPDIKLFSNVSAVIPFTSKQDKDNFKLEIAQYMNYNDINYQSIYEDSLLEKRTILYLQNHQLLPPNPANDIADLELLYSDIKESGMLTDSKDGYNSNSYLHGILIDGKDQSGKRLIMASFRGCEVSNDHYPFYELLFVFDSQNKSYKLISGQKFFYDVSGYEGLNWEGIWMILRYLGILCGLTLLNIIQIAIIIKNKSNKLNLEEQNKSAPPS